MTEMLAWMLPETPFQIINGGPLSEVWLFFVSLTKLCIKLFKQRWVPQFML